MKSALAGMYPAMSRDSTESNVGRGGSSVAVVSEKQEQLKYEQAMLFLFVEQEQ